MKNFPVATICGSMKLFPEMVQVAARLTQEGYIVLMPLVAVAMPERNAELKHMLDIMHFQKIDMSGHVFIVWRGEYLGESTSREVEYAKRSRKQIHWVDV